MDGQDGRLPWLHRISLRLRLTVLTALVVAAAVALGGLLILVSLESELLRAADDAGKERAQELAVLAAEGSLPTPLPEMQDPETFAEVVSNGQIITETAGLDQRSAFELPERKVGQIDLVEVSRLPLDKPGPYRVVAHGVDTSTGPMTIFVAVPVHDVEHTMSAATRIGAIGLTGLVGVLATVMWLAIGRTLAPVNAIRIRADAISGQNLDLRVPTPAQHDEIGRLAITVNQMLGRLQVSAENQRRFVADAAHELRSPIASLRVQLETARDRDGAGDRETDMLHETARMEVLIDQLLLLARADADTPWVRLSMVDLDDVVDSVVSSLGSDGRVAIDTSAVEPLQLSGDAGLLEQVVRNLVQNAVSHASEMVRVSVSRLGGNIAVLIVDDDGPGVPQDRREDIFGRFVRLDDSRDRGRGGVGLGLSIVSEIVRAHGGGIYVSDSPSGGARFVVKLSISRVDTRADQSHDRGENSPQVG